MTAAIACVLPAYSFSLTKPSQLQVRSRIVDLEAAMRARPDQFDPECKAFPVRHFKAPGMVARQMLIPKGMLIVGKIHKHAHLNHITYGHVKVETEHGSREIKGPDTFTSEVGTKRAVVALEDTLWTTFHLNPNNYDPENEDDMKKFEAEIIAKSYDELPAPASHKEVKEVAA
ncbi:hypothetical protein [Polaromonas sp. JS666]|uniref:hypothetical protein n=1 Tax=Polaromonas sp. (strain JS666 / ATCC BAA-500) TaxID=296591 RepID=UPI0009444258|nr:hypothetical protein [Polaromonas sp. JS666]